MLKSQLITGLIGLAGAALFLVLNLPLPFLLGPLTFCLLTSLAGAKLKANQTLSKSFRTILGVAIGASFTPDVLREIPQMAPTLIAVPFFILFLALTSIPLLVRVFKLDHVTAYYCAMPGGLQDLLVFGEEAGGNLRALSLIHATRVLLIVGLAPPILTAIWHVDLVAPPGKPAIETDIYQIILLVGSGLIGWAIAAKVRLLGASILGPMIFTAVLSIAGIITTRPPAEMIWASQFFIATGIGVKYVGLTFQEFRRFVMAGVANGIQLAIISGIFIWGMAKLGFAPGLELFLAFIPGGQSEIVVLAIIAGADLTFVVLHHIIRIATVIICAPIFFRLRHKNPS